MRTSYTVKWIQIQRFSGNSFEDLIKPELHEEFEKRQT